MTSSIRWPGLPFGLGLTVTLCLLALTVTPPAMMLAASTVGCGTAPVGTANTAEDPEPPEPVWCEAAGGVAPVTLVPDGFGGWTDSMANGAVGPIPATLDPAAYRVQDNVFGTGAPAQHWTVNGYFGSDLAKPAGQNGDDMSPNQTVRFQGGKLVLEADFAASIHGFANSSGGDVAWGEVVASTSQTLDSTSTVDGLYSYGYHRGFWTFGCRIQAAKRLTCAVEADHDLATTTGDSYPCFSQFPARVIEMSGHQQCGGTHSGFAVDFGAPGSVWRTCPFDAAGNTTSVDACLERYRFEWSQDGFRAYVNGVKFAEDTGWPAQAQLPASLVDGSTPLYAHFADWGDGADGRVYRFHWGRVAANPHDSAGNLLPPSASCQFLGTCGGPSPSPSPSPTPSPSAFPTSTPSPTAGPFACNLRYPDVPGGRPVGHAGTCTRQPDGSFRFVAG